MPPPLTTFAPGNTARDASRVGIRSIDIGNEPFGSRPELGACLLAFILLQPHGEVPEGRARVNQDTVTLVQSKSEG